MLLVKRSSNAQKSIDAGVVIVTAFKLVILILEVGETVLWAPNDTEKLWDRENEVKDLWDKEEKHCLAKMAKDCGDSESHPREVAVGITHEDLRREGIVLHQSQRGH